MAVTNHIGWASAEGVSSLDGRGWVRLQIGTDLSWYTTNPADSPDQAVTVGGFATSDPMNTWVWVRIEAGQIREVTYYG